ncbi:MAG: hypothetical protein R3B54_16555 [Bdellovibrionota bacterium]
MLKVLTTSFLLLAAVPALADSLFDIDSLFDPGVDLTSIVGNGGVAQGTTTINPEFVNLNPTAATSNLNANSSLGLPGMGSADAQLIAGNPKLRQTLDFFLRCIAQYGGVAMTSQAQDDPFGFGNSAPTGINIGDTSNPTVRFCIETAKTQMKELLIHTAQAALTAIEQQQHQQQQQDLSLIMSFLAQNGGDQDTLNILPLLLGTGGGNINPALLLGGGF